MKAQEKYDTIINNIKEVSVGKRGFVSISAKIANAAGTNQKMLALVAKSLKLKVEQHGKYGYCVTK